MSTNTTTMTASTLPAMTSSSSSDLMTMMMLESSKHDMDVLTGSSQLLREAMTEASTRVMDEDVFTFSPFAVILSIFLGLIILITIVGNVFVMLAIYIEKNLQTVGNYLVFSLALADLLVAGVVMPIGAIAEVNGQWRFGSGLCDFWTCMDVMSCSASILHLVAIAFDRYRAVTNIDYIQTRTSRTIGVMIGIVWLVAVVISVAPVLGWKDDHYMIRIEVEKRCLLSQDVAYQIVATCATFYLPLILLLILYWKIFKVARKRIRHKPGSRLTTSPNVTKSNDSHQSKGHSKHKHLHPQRHQQAIQVSPPTSSQQESTNVLSREEKEKAVQPAIDPPTSTTNTTTTSTSRGTSFSAIHPPRPPSSSSTSSTQQQKDPSPSPPPPTTSLGDINEKTENNGDQDKTSTSNSSSSVKRKGGKFSSSSIKGGVDVAAVESPTTCRLDDQSPILNGGGGVDNDVEGGLIEIHSDRLPQDKESSDNKGITSYSEKSDLTLMDGGVQDGPTIKGRMSSTILESFQDMDGGDDEDQLHQLEVKSVQVISATSTSSTTWTGVKDREIEGDSSGSLQGIHPGKNNSSRRDSSPREEEDLLMDVTSQERKNASTSKEDDDDEEDEEEEDEEESMRMKHILLCFRSRKSSTQKDKMKDIESLDMTDRHQAISPSILKVKSPKCRPSSRTSAQDSSSRHVVLLDQPNHHPKGESSPSASTSSSSSSSHHKKKSKSRIFVRKMFKKSSPCHPGEGGLRTGSQEDTSSSTSPSAQGKSSGVMMMSKLKSLSTSKVNQVISHKESLEAKRERKAAKTLVIITASFIICWLPFFVHALVMPICGESCSLPDFVESIVLWLGYINSTINPIIYTIFSMDFRTAFKKILCGHKWRPDNDGRGRRGK